MALASPLPSPENDRTVMESSIEKVLQQFDFARVHTAMTALDWQWGLPNSTETAVPTVEQIQSRARELLVTIWEENELHQETTVGGLRASRDEHALVLEFVLESKHAVYREEAE